MIKLTLILLIAIISMYANEDVKTMKTLKKMIEYDRKKVVIINKDDLANYIESQKQSKVIKNASDNIQKVDSPVERNFMIVEKEQPKVKKRVIKTITNYDEYVEFIDNKDIDKIYKMVFIDNLKAVKYVYENGLEGEHYSYLKAGLIKDVDKYNFIDKIAFTDALNNMDIDVISEILNDLKGAF